MKQAEKGSAQRVRSKNLRSFDRSWISQPQGRHRYRRACTLCLTCGGCAEPPCSPQGWPLECFHSKQKAVTYLIKLPSQVTRQRRQVELRREREQCRRVWRCRHPVGAIGSDWPAAASSISYYCCWIPRCWMLCCRSLHWPLNMQR